MSKNARLLYLFLGVLPLYGCFGTVPLTPTEATPTSQYRLHQLKDGFSVAADPCLDPEQMLRYFGTDLLSYGILPIQISVTNMTSRTLYLRPNGFSLDVGPGGAERGVRQENLLGPLQGERATVNRVFAWIPPGFGMGLFQYNTDMSTIEANIIRRVLPERFLYPGESCNGFLYFKIAERNTTTDTISSLLFAAPMYGKVKMMDPIDRNGVIGIIADAVLTIVFVDASNTKIGTMELNLKGN